MRETPSPRHVCLGRRSKRDRLGSRPPKRGNRQELAALRVRRSLSHDRGLTVLRPLVHHEAVGSPQSAELIEEHGAELVLGHRAKLGAHDQGIGRKTLRVLVLEQRVVAEPTPKRAGSFFPRL